MTIDCESDSPLLPAWYPSKGDRDNASLEMSNLLENRLREVKVPQRRVTPTPSIVRQSIVWGAEISGCHHNRRRKAPLVVVGAPDLEARPAAHPSVEQRRAQGRRVRPVPLAVQIAVPTCSSHGARGIAATVEGGMSIHPTFTAAVDMAKG